MALKRSSLENYTLLLVELNKMRHTNFNAKTFLKKMRPFCKTSHLKFKTLFLRIRGSNIGITIRVCTDCFVVTQSFCVHEFIFYCNSQKTLITKLLKHNLLTP